MFVYKRSLNSECRTTPSFFPNPECRIPNPPSSGFTLVEMAVVMVIMGLVMMTVLPALNTVRASNQTMLTQSNLRSLMLATAAYVQSNGCLPCPAIPGGTGTDFGKTGSLLACGECSAAKGIPPFAALGVPSSIAHDGWGHWITMRVDPALTNPSPVFVPPTAPCTIADVANGQYGCTTVGSSVKGLCRSGFDPSNRITVMTTGGGGPQSAAVIFVSHGATGYGSYIASPKERGGAFSFPSNYAGCSSVGGYALCNAADTTTFYDAPKSISDAYSYDDVLAYADRNSLVSLLGNGACQTTW